MSPKRYTVIALNVSDEERDQVHNLARQRGYGITSDYLRALIIADAKKHGFPLTFSVNRGGWRKRDKD